jgi:membrane protein YqaA with SNARE-associated domain
LLHNLTTTLVEWGPLGILLLAILDSGGVPVAGVFDAFLILIAVERPSVAWLCATIAVLGSTFGSTVLFLTARRGGRMMKQDGPRAAKFRAWFNRYGLITVFIPSLVPIPMPLKLFVISAGVMATPLGEFVGVIFFSRLVRYFGETWLGIHLGHDSTTFLKSHVWHFTIGSVLLFAALYGWVLWREKARGVAQ